MTTGRIGIVGAGPGGLTAGMLLAHRGYDVHVFECKDRVGGRNAPLQLGEFTFDTGPTFLMMKFILESIFEDTGRELDDYLNLTRLDPLYRLKIGDIEFHPSADLNKTRERIASVFPGNEKGLDKFLEKENKRFESLFPCLKRPYSKLTDFLSPTLLAALPRMSIGRSIFSNLGRYFTDDDLKLCFSFQSKYLGMSPWTCPAFFTMLSYIEHAYGIYHVEGGLNQISQTMAEIIREEGGEVHLNSPVSEVTVEDGSATGLLMEGGNEEHFDSIVLNADFGHAMNNLVPSDTLNKYTPEKLSNWGLSCSTFMLYLGVDREYSDLPHHNIIFADDYEQNVDEVMESQTVPSDPSFYVQNASVTDSTLAPEGKSTVYVLVPVPNTRSGIDWNDNKESFRDRMLGLLEDEAGFTDLRDHIEEQHVVTPDDWEGDYNVYDGATFNLAHTMFQLLYFRPHNRFEEIDNVYLVGGGTHPGSGLPTIYESGRISTDLINEDLK